MMPKLLYVATHKADPNGTGVERRTAQFVEALGSAGALTVVASDLAPEAPFAPPEALGYHALVRDDHLEARLNARNAARLQRLFGALTWASDFKPDYDPQAIKRAIAPLAEQFFDAVVLSHLQAAHWFSYAAPRLKYNHARVFIDLDDIPSELLARQRAQERNPSLALRLLRWRHQRTIRAFEDRLLGTHATLLVCSEHDQAKLRARAPHARLGVIPNAITLPDPPLAQKTPATPCHLLFVGALGYAPNAQGILWFAGHVWPKLTPGAFCLSIVGRDPPPEVRALEAVAGIRVNANVPDVRPYYAACDLAIAPILFGGGTRIKILEALAHKRGVVATPIGAEGLLAGSGHGIVQAEAPQAMAAALEALRANPQALLELGSAGFASVSQHYAMAHIQHKVRALIQA
jgi:glycosyltransferase involved in cell wall biosynthesis